MLCDDSPISTVGSDSQPSASPGSDSDAATEISERDPQEYPASTSSPVGQKLSESSLRDDYSVPSLPIVTHSGSRTPSNDDFYTWHRQRLLSADNTATPEDLQSRPNSLVKPHLTLLHAPSSHQVDPFASLPIEVDYTTNELLHFYLGSNTAYWSSAYALSPKVKPSIKSAWESFMPCPEHFHILMARSALHQLRINPSLDPSFRKNLQLASIAHQGKAVASLRQKVGKGTQMDHRNVFVAVLSLATFELRYGQKESAKMHFAVGRTIVHNLGREEFAKDKRKEIQALWFDGIYTEPEASFMWSSGDLAANHTHLAQLLKDVDNLWRSWPQESVLVRRAGGRKRFISSRSVLHKLLHRDCRGQLLSIYRDIDQHVAQTRCLLICVAVIIGLWMTENKLRDSRDAVNAIQAWTDWVEQVLLQGELDADAAMPDLLWCLLQDPMNQGTSGRHGAEQGGGSIQERLRDFDFQECQWRVSGIANAVKTLSDVWQLHIRRWLLGFLDGAMYDGELVVDQFAFSYAAGQTEAGC